MNKLAEYLKQDLLELQEMMSFQTELMKRYSEMKDKVYQNIALQALGREFRPEDGPDFNIAVTEGKDYELIAYKGNILGSIRFHMGYDGDDLRLHQISAGWTFNPEEKDFKKP